MTCLLHKAAAIPSEWIHEAEMRLELSIPLRLDQPHLLDLAVALATRVTPEVELGYEVPEEHIEKVSRFLNMRRRRKSTTGSVRMHLERGTLCARSQENYFYGTLPALKSPEYFAVLRHVSYQDETAKNSWFYGGIIYIFHRSPKLPSLS